MTTAQRAVHAEWTKARTVAGPWWLLATVVLGTIGLGAAATASIRCSGTDCHADVVRTSLSGVWLGQAAVAGFAVLLVGSEYSTNQILPTLTAVPRRHLVVAAKAVTSGLPALLAGLVGATGSIMVGRLILGADHDTAVAAAALSPIDPTVLQAVGGTALYLGLIALLATGLTTAVRSSAGGIGAVLGVLYLFPMLAAVVTDRDWVLTLRRISPSNAGLSVQSTTGASGEAIGPWAGLGVVALWSAGALLLGTLILRYRDA